MLIRELHEYDLKTCEKTDNSKTIVNAATVGGIWRTGEGKLAMAVVTIPVRDGAIL